jgi:hypothetical protein
MWSIITAFIVAHAELCTVVAGGLYLSVDKGIQNSKKTVHNGIFGAIIGGLKGFGTGLLGLVPQIGQEIAQAKPGLAPAVTAAEQVIAAAQAPQATIAPAARVVAIPTLVAP